MSRRASSAAKVSAPLKKVRACEGDGVTGLDADGTRYGSAEELWAKEKKKGLKNWYGSAIEYWSAVPATVDGVLGGFGSVSATDLIDSARFLDDLADAGYNTRAKEAAKGKTQSPSSRAVDCGAGVGRIAAGLLVHRFRQVDVVEPVEHLMQQAKDSLQAIGHTGELYQVSLEHFTAAPATYDCIWIQWVIMFLVDDDLVAFLQVPVRQVLCGRVTHTAQRCRRMLKPKGVICVKENVSEQGFVVDREDSSVMRDDKHFKLLFERAGCSLQLEAQQQHFPEELKMVKMYALA